MAKSKHLKKRRSVIASRRLRRNPEGSVGIVPMTAPAAKSIAVDTASALAGYAATRLLSRIAFSQAVKRWPALAPHAQAISSAVAFGAVWLVGGWWRDAGPYHQPAIVGSGIAAVQAIIQSYVPKFGWILSDCRRSDYVSSANILTPLPPIDDQGLEVDTSTQAADPTAEGAAAQPDPAQADDDFSSLQGGIFAAN